MTAPVYQLLKQIGSKNCWSNVLSIAPSNSSQDELLLVLPVRPGDNRLYLTLLMPTCFRT